MLKPAYWAVGVALFLATLAVFAGPTVAYWANGKNIVGDATSAASYAGASIGLMGAALAASGAFVAYEIQKRDQQRIRVRTCAILVKIAIRLALEDVLETFEFGLRVVRREDRPKLLGVSTTSTPSAYDLPSGSEVAVKAFFDRYKNIRNSLSLDAQAGEALAHLEGDLVSNFLIAHAGVARILSDVADTRGVSQFGYAFGWVEVTLDNLLKLNNALGEILGDTTPEAERIGSTAYWITNDKFAVPS